MQAPFADPLSGLDVDGIAGFLEGSIPTHMLDTSALYSPARLSLVGRETEMQVIRALLETVALNRPTGAHALMITGDVGIGKSRLLAEMYLEARARGFSVLEGRTYESGGMFPYLPFIEALRPVIRSSTIEELRRYLGTGDHQGPRQGAIHRTPTSDEEHPGADRIEEDLRMGVIHRAPAPLVAALASLFPDLPGILQIAPAIHRGVTTPEAGQAPGPHTASEPPLVPTAADQEKFRLFDAVATLLEGMAMEHPVLLGIDNLQWADSGSLELTMYLTVRLHDSHVALVGVTRPPGTLGNQTDDTMVTTMASSAAARTLSELARQGQLLLLPLRPLEAGYAEQYLHALLPGTVPQEIAQTLLERAEGNPFFLEELVRTLTLNGRPLRTPSPGWRPAAPVHTPLAPTFRDVRAGLAPALVLHDGEWEVTRAISSEVPESIALAVSQRLQGLSAACREFLRVASLFGRTFALDALVYVLKESEDRAQSLLDEAIQASIIARVPESTSEELKGRPQAPLRQTPMYMFCQGIVQEVLTASVPSFQAQALHGAIGAALERGYATGEPNGTLYEPLQPPVHAAELARHFVLSGDQQGALRWSLRAGKYAARQQAHREAISHLRQVLRLLGTGVNLPPGQALPSPAELYLLIGQSWFKLGELEQAAHSFQLALQDLQRTWAEQDSRATQGSPPTGNRKGPRRGAIHRAPTSPPPLLLAQMNRLLADVYRMQGKYDQALAHLRTASHAFVGSMVNSTGERILLLQAQATLAMFLGRTQEAEAQLWESHQLATDIGDPGSQAFALQLLGWLRGWGEHIHEAIRFQEQAYELYVAIGDPFRAALVDQVLGIVYQALGEMEHARLCTLRSFERARRYGARGILGLLHWNLGVMALAQGDWSSSDSRLQQAWQEAEANNDARLKPVVLQAQAELQFRRGNWHEAELLFQASIRAASTTEWIAGSVALYGHFLAMTGRRNAARAQLDRAADYPEPPGLAGSFYIPFLAEGYIHIGENERAAAYIERIRSMKGFMYYGVSVDRILGVVATLAGPASNHPTSHHPHPYETAERAFEDGLALCRRANNEPEEAAILYEQARAILIMGNLSPEWRPDARITTRGLRTIPRIASPSPVPTATSEPLQAQLHERLHELCERARAIFLRYSMQRAAELVDTLQRGVHELSQPLSATPSSLTERELEVLRLVAEGHTDREVAETLVISPRTVNRHLSNIFVKLDVPGRAGAVAYAIRQGIV